MSEPPVSLKGLRGRLLDIPDEKFVEIVHLLEQVGDRPEVRETFDHIRPRLARMRPERRLTLKRVFCDPFEDVLEAARLSDVPVGAIERAVIDPLWRVVEERGDRRHLDPLAEAVRRVPSGDHAGRHTLGCRLWWVAAAAIRAALAGADRDPRAFLRGNEAHIRQARDIAEFLEIGHAITELKNCLPPKPIQSLSDEDLAAIEAAVKETARTDTGKPYYLLLVVASRLRKPADLLAALGDMDFGKARREKPVVFARLSGLVVTSLEDRSLHLEGIDESTLTPSDAVEFARMLVESLDSTCAVMDRVNETAYDRRLQSVRTAVKGMVETTVLAAAPAGIAAAVPDPSRGGAIPGPPDDARQIRAEEHALALRTCESFAGALGLDHRVAQTLESVSRDVETRAERMIAGLRDAEPLSGDDEDNGAELATFYAVRLLELVGGSSRADRLRARAMEALFGRGT
ncbi:hypothetical protein [Azospirillum halopraeferens]|uniref:hypothetical protein n=1 Tax=Azospirillum halopraeferens TaxID=34010 RepID=UPI000684D33C|nr:hypothetical protein [Azospirillum halopraeferens]